MKKEIKVDSMCRILVIHTSAAKGGAEHSLLELINNWKDKPIELYLVWSPLPFPKNRFPSFIKHQDVCIPYLKKSKTFSSFLKSIKIIFSGAITIWRLVKKEKIQVLYCNTLRSLPYCFLVGWFSRVRIVCHCRDNIPKLLRVFTHFVTVEFIVVSSSIYDQLPKKSNTCIIYNGINLHLFPADVNPSWLHYKYNLSKNVQLIGSIGNILPWKNQLDYVLVAISLLKENPNLHFFLIGEVVDKNYLSFIKEQIQAAGFEFNFTFTGYIDEVQNYLACMSIIIHTAIKEPFGRVLIEAGASCIPVIAYDSGSASEIIIDNITGYLIPEKNIDRMVELTTKLLASVSLIHSMGLSAREHVISMFSSEDCALKTYEILNNTRNKRC